MSTFSNPKHLLGQDLVQKICSSRYYDANSEPLVPVPLRLKWLGLSDTKFYERTQTPKSSIDMGHKNLEKNKTRAKEENPVGIQPM